MGTAYAALQRWDDAITCFSAVSEDLLYETPHYAHTNIGWAYFNKNALKLAERHYRKALSLQPNFVIALYGLGQVFERRGERGQAASFFQQVVRLAPRSPQATAARRSLGETE